MGHLVAHSSDKLAVEFGALFRDLESVNVRCHQFERVQRPQPLLNRRQSGLGHSLTSQVEISLSHFRTSNLILVHEPQGFA